MTEQLKYVSIAVDALADKKAEDIKVLDISEISSLGDYFIISNGNNINQVQAMADQVLEKLSEAGLKPRQIEGYQNANWILLDFYDFVVHIFDYESRRYYDIERIWRDGIEVNL